MKGRFVIIESDDWGAIRTPSAAVLKAFERKGLELSQSVYKYDSLESDEDLGELFSLLNCFHDYKGNPLKITANVIVANPDFEKIKAGNFRQYFFEDVRKTLEEYPEHNHVYNKWQQGIKEGYFQPQFHGREHLQYKRWLKTLQEGNADALFCFDHGATYSGKSDYSFMEAYDWDHPGDVEEHKVIIAEGLRMFESLFGYTSKSFIAPCYNWDPAIETTLANNGVQMIQGIRNQLVPTGTFDKYDSLPHYFGERNNLGLTYNVRNCFLEPSLLPGKDWVDSCLAQVKNAFLWQKPAVICSHRINFIGSINPLNRERGLTDLKTTINKVLKEWPDVQFISTDQLAELLSHN
jgi:hypothetical protein